LAEKEELEAQAQMQEQAAQEGDANEVKARTQAAKNAMQAQKISADTDKIEMENMAVQQVINTPGSMDNAVVAKLFGGGK
jgi:DNA-binding protein H-NS